MTSPLKKNFHCLSLLSGKLLLLSLLLFCTACALTRQLLPHKKRSKSTLSAPADTTKAKAKAEQNRLKPYRQVINKNYKTQNGLFTVHQYKDSVYFEIPISLFHRDIQVISRLDKGPGGIGIYSGEALDERTIHFEMGPDSTLRIRYTLVISQADSTSAIYKSVVKSNLNPVVSSFPIKALSLDSSAYVIDVTSFLKSKSLVNQIQPNSELAKNIKMDAIKDYYVESIRSYPINVELYISKNTETQPKNAAGQPSSDPGEPVSFVTHTSFVLLPAVPMLQRIADERVGIFADYVYNFGDNQQKVEKRNFILRWRLEAKDEDLEKWKKGELVEPKKPIVIYIDPAAPKQWRPYLVAGINDWQNAFEQAGFKNAIQGKEWPENDTTMHMDDARYSFLKYAPSEIANAYGPQVHDPRSGEIIQTNIIWYHNVMQLLHTWYMTQAGAVDPQARKAKFDDELMGELIRFVSSHEVGHSLGLRHNMGSSSLTPVDSLRNKAYLERHGHTASIMDYARFNYVAQPEDNIPQHLLFPRIGEYDKWAIEWSYRPSGAATSEEDKKINCQWINTRLAKNPRLWFGADNRETERKDPRCLMEDLGDNAIKASHYGIKNLQRILPNLPEWTREEGGHYDNLTRMYTSVTKQYQNYIQHVMTNIAGVYTTPRGEEEQHAVVYAPTPKAKQEEALRFFHTQLFTTPYWLLDKKVTEKVKAPTQPDFVEDLQVKTLNTLLDSKKMDQLLANMRQFGTQAYPLDAYIRTIHQGIWKELATGKAMDPYRRSLQKAYVGCLQKILTSPKDAETETDVASLLRADLLQLQREIAAGLPKLSQPLDRYHLQDVQTRIKRILDVNLTM